MDPMREAIAKRRFKNSDPGAYIDEQTIDGAAEEEVAEMDDMGGDVRGTDTLAPDLEIPMDGDAMMGAGEEEMLMGDQAMAGDPMGGQDDAMMMERMQAMIDEGRGPERPGLRGKAMRNIQGLMGKIKG